jgi:hypothetical protein
VIAVAAWAATGVALALGDRLLWELLWIAGSGLVTLYQVVGLGLLALILWRVWADRSRVAFGLLGGFLVVVFLVFSQAGRLSGWGDDLLFHIRFTRGLPYYERVIAALSTPSGASPAAGSPRFVVDSGPPIRVAFRLPGGMLDNWEGVIYDPSGAVAAARGWGPRNTFTAPTDVRLLFGGDLVTCEVVRRPYYRCWFT